jgi:predicted lysophospholipase L1 biosynthesis ABC-type transport system permease subunit
MALGGSRQAMALLVVRDGAKLVGTGLVVGAGLAFVVTRPLAAFLVAQLPTSDPWSFGMSAVVLALTSVVAAFGPARRAMRVEPVITLRAE